MEDVLVEALRTQLNFIKQSAPTQKKEMRSASMECYKAITQIEKELAQFPDKKLERYESYRSGEISREDFIESKDALSVKADELTAKKEQLEKEYQALLKAKQQESETESEVARAEQVLTDFDAGLHEHLYEAIERVIVTSNEQIEIEWVFEDIFTHKEKYC